MIYSPFSCLVNYFKLYIYLYIFPSQSWVSEIKKEENKIHFHETETFPAMKENLPPVRSSDSCLHVAKVGLFGVGCGWQGKKVVVGY